MNTIYSQLEQFNCIFTDNSKDIEQVENQLLNELGESTFLLSPQFIRKFVNFMQHHYRNDDLLNEFLNIANHKDVLINAQTHGEFKNLLVDCLFGLSAVPNEELNLTLVVSEPEYALSASEVYPFVNRLHNLSQQGVKVIILLSNGYLATKSLECIIKNQNQGTVKNHQNMKLFYLKKDNTIQLFDEYTFVDNPIFKQSMEIFVKDIHAYGHLYGWIE